MAILYGSDEAKWQPRMAILEERCLKAESVLEAKEHELDGFVWRVSSLDATPIQWSSS